MYVSAGRPNHIWPDTKLMPRLKSISSRFCFDVSVIARLAPDPAQNELRCSPNGGADGRVREDAGYDAGCSRR
jgi:hypothetical protein